MRATKQSPAQTCRALDGDIRLAEMTLAECVTLYRSHLIQQKTRPAKDSTLRGGSIRATSGRPLVDLITRRLSSLVSEFVILDAFGTLASGRRYYGKARRG